MAMVRAGGRQGPLPHWEKQWHTKESTQHEVQCSTLSRLMPAGQGWGKIGQMSSSFADMRHLALWHNGCGGKEAAGKVGLWGRSTPRSLRFEDTVLLPSSQQQQELGWVSLGGGRRMNLESQKKSSLKKIKQAQEPIFPNWKAVFKGTKRSVA